MRAKVNVPFVIAENGVKLAEGRILSFIAPSEAPVLEMDLPKLAEV